MTDTEKDRRIAELEAEAVALRSLLSGVASNVSRVEEERGRLRVDVGILEEWLRKSQAFAAGIAIASEVDRSEWAMHKIAAGHLAENLAALSSPGSAPAEGYSVGGPCPRCGSDDTVVKGDSAAQTCLRCKNGSYAPERAAPAEPRHHCPKCDTSDLAPGHMVLVCVLCADLDDVELSLAAPAEPAALPRQGARGTKSSLAPPSASGPVETQADGLDGAPPHRVQEGGTIELCAREADAEKTLYEENAKGCAAARNYVGEAADLHGAMACRAVAERIRALPAPTAGAEGRHSWSPLAAGILAMLANRGNPGVEAYSDDNGYVIVGVKTAKGLVDVARWLAGEATTATAGAEEPPRGLQGWCQCGAVRVRAANIIDGRWHRARPSMCDSLPRPEPLFDDEAAESFGRDTATKGDRE